MAGDVQPSHAGLRHGVFPMDPLIAVGSLAAYFYSLFQLLRGSLHLYFDTASMLVSLLVIERTRRRRRA